jgi:hypothetical protein
VVLAEADEGLHLRKAGQRGKGEGGVGSDVEVIADEAERGEVDACEHDVAVDFEGSTNVGKGGEVNTSEHVVDLDAEVSLRARQRGVD